LEKIILVRHGETDWNKSHRIQGGSSDTILNENGRQQAEKAAIRLKSENIQAIYSSPLQRALDTARAIARYHRLNIETEASLREIEVGKLEGVLVSEVGKHLDEIMTEGSEGGFPPVMPGGESLIALQERAWTTVRNIAQKHPEGEVVVVCHYFVLLSIICSAINLPISQIGRFRVNAGSISTIIFEGERTRLVLFNDISHQTS